MYVTFVRLCLLFIPLTLLLGLQLAPTAAHCVTKESSFTTKALDACFSSLATSPLLRIFITMLSGKMES